MGGRVDVHIGAAGLDLVNDLGEREAVRARRVGRGQGPGHGAGSCLEGQIHGAVGTNVAHVNVRGNNGSREAAVDDVVGD